MWTRLQKIFKNIFSESGNKEQMLKVSSLSNFKTMPGKIVVSQSEVPAYIEIGNLIFQKNYIEAIELGEKILLNTPGSAGTHVNLMVSYFKIRNSHPDYIYKCIEHARLAMLYGHNTGYVQQRLVISLVKEKRLYEALQICEIVLSDQYHFSKFGCGTKDEFLKRKREIENKIKKGQVANQQLYTKVEIAQIFNNLPSAL